LECIGYVVTVKPTEETPDWTEGPHIVQAMTILVAPPLMAATIYMILGRIILTTDGEAFDLIKKWLTKVFLCGDVLSFLVLAGGVFLFSYLRTLRSFKRC